MKSGWMALVVVLQVLTLGVLLGIALRDRSQSGVEDELRELRSAVTGAVARENQIAIGLDQLRGQLDGWARQMRGDLAPPEETSGEAGSSNPGKAAGDAEEGPAAGPPSAVPLFAEAHDCLERLKELHTERKKLLQQEGAPFLGPLDQRMAEQRQNLLRYGVESLHWVNVEVTREPWDPADDPAFTEYLLREVLPELAEASPEDAFAVARDALLTVTNENPVRLAGAASLRKIAPDRWVKEYADVIQRGRRTDKDVSLRVSLLQAFEEAPRPEAVELCRTFLQDPSHPIALRTRSVHVLVKQASEAVVPTLRKALFEDHAVDVRMAALDGLHKLLGKDERKRLLEDVLNADPAQMMAAVQEKAKRMIEEGR